MFCFRSNAAGHPHSCWDHAANPAGLAGYLCGCQEEETGHTQQSHHSKPMSVLPGSCLLKRTFTHAFSPSLLIFSFLFFSVSVESYDSAHDYEKVDGEKAEHATHANLGDHPYEDSFQGEPFEGGTFKDDDEADYVNVTTECNVQFVEIYGEGVSSPNVLVLNATSEDEEFIDIYGEEDCIYQNMGLR